MSKVVRVQGGDYKIVVGSTITPGKIVLDTNPAGEFGAQGEVRITGDLVVMGNTTVIKSETLTVKDNIIEINKGETGEGVTTLGSTAGIQIDRGSEFHVSFLWDENLESRYPTFNLNLPGTFKFTNASNLLLPIATNSINTFGGNLALISTGSGVITVTGTADYEERILNYSKLNSLFEIVSIRRQLNVATITLDKVHNLQNSDRVDVTCFPNSTFNASNIPVTIIDDITISYNSTGPNVPLTTFGVGIGGTVQPNSVIDDDRIPNMKAVVDYSKSSLATVVPVKIQEQDTKVEVSDIGITGLSEITFVVDGNQRAVINNTGLYVDNINIFGNNISNFLNDNIRFDSVLSLKNQLDDPAPISGYVTVYSQTEPGAGGTGIYFIDNIGNNDELISKTKAFLYALIL